MDEETNKIKQHIDDEREQLGRNLDEIEDRMKNLTSLKAHFNKNTGWVMGAAVAGGFLLSLAVRKPPTPDSGLRSESGFRSTANMPVQPRHSGPARLGRISETVDNIFEGLVAVASDKLQSFVADAVPGFRVQYDAVEQQRRRS